MAKKLTKNQQEYQKQIARLKRAIRKLEKEGYKFTEDIIPKVPQRVTKKSLQQISSIKPKQLKELATKSTTYYPQISLIDVVREQLVELTHIHTTQQELSELERKHYPFFPIEKRKQVLIDIFDDTVTYYSEDLSQLEEYLAENQNDISIHLNIISYDSKAENVNVSFAHLGALLNVTPLSMSQAEDLSAISDFYYEEVE